MARIKRAKKLKQLRDIEEAVRRSHGPLTRAQIESAYAQITGTALVTRTIARRLSELINAGKLLPLGKGRNTLYQAVAPKPSAPRPEEPEGSSAAAPTSDGVDAAYVPLSPEGAEVRTLIAKPYITRPPVGYQPEFLENYQPGVDWYLPLTTRQKLTEVGTTPDRDRPAGTYARQILDQLLIDLSWGSSKLEGNTYNRLDTKNLIEFGRHAEGKDLAEAQMIMNHRRAIEMLVDSADRIGFNRYTLLNLHSMLAENLLPNPDDEGRLRKSLVGIGNSAYVPPSVPQKIEEWFDLILAKAGAIPDPFEQAFFVMVQLPYLQPFADVNKRTSRLAANIPLIRANLIPLSFVDVPERAYVEGLLGVYEFNRVELFRDVFVWAYERSVQQYRVLRESIGAPDPLRLKYRQELRRAIHETVVNGAPPDREALSVWAQANGVETNDVGGFAERALEQLLSLHAGNSARYELLESQLKAWKDKFDPNRTES